MQRINSFVLIAGLLAIGMVIATNHFGVAIRLSNYYFALLFLVSIYNLMTND